MFEVKTLEQICDNFKSGKFKVCLKNINAELEQLQQENVNNRKMSTTWTLEHNQIISIFLSEFTTSNEKSVHQKAAKTTYCEMKSLLKQVNSIPVDLEYLMLELTTTYNLILAFVLSLKNSVFDHNEIQKKISSVLKKVIKYHGLNLEEQTTSLKEMFKTVLLECFREEYKGQASVVNLCCAWCFVLLQTADRQEAISYMSLCSGVDADNISKSKELFMVPLGVPLGFGLDVCHLEESVSDQLNFVWGLSLYLTPKKRHLSKQYFLKVKNKHWQSCTSHLLGYIEYEAGMYVEALMTLGQASNTEAPDDDVKALHCNLYAQCFSKLGKHHCAIEKYKEALELDFESLGPLYYISLEYRDLGLVDAELESLNLLITALENRQDTVAGRQSVLYEALHSNQPDISLTQALYTLAHRCLQLKKYEAASQRYMDLQCCISNPVTLKIHADEGFPLPPVKQIYLQSIYSLLKSKQYEDCIALCDHLLECSDKVQGHFNGTSEDDNLVDDSEVKGQGRKRILSSDTHDSCQYDAYGYLYKTEALIHNGKLKEAVECLERAMEPLGSCLVLHSNKPQQSSQPEKRRKLESGETTHSSTEFSVCGDVNKLASDVYSHLGAALAADQSHKDALHFLRLSLQLNQGNTSALYNITLVLSSLGRDQEAFHGWSRHRSFSASDSFTLNKILRQRKEALTRSQGSVSSPKFPDMVSDLAMDTVCEKQVLQLDILCLQHMLQHKNSKW